MGIVVDRVYDVAEIKEGEVQVSPRFGPDVNTDLILGMAKEPDCVIILLDIDQIFHTEDMIQVARAA
jgi:chemotaxis signal transduction protein